MLNLFKNISRNPWAEDRPCSRFMSGQENRDRKRKGTCMHVLVGTAPTVPFFELYVLFSAKFSNTLTTQRDRELHTGITQQTKL
jgi:hypothetical protein